MTANLNLVRVSDVQSSENKNKVKSTGGSFAAAGAGLAAVQVAATPLSLYALNKVIKYTDLPEDKIEIVHQAAEKAIKEAKLPNNVKINYIPERVPKNLIEKLAIIGNPIESIKHGLNACTFFKDLKINGKIIYHKGDILMPEKSLAVTVFHEIGHQMNSNFSKFGHFLQNLRPVAIFAPVAILLYGAFTQNSETKDGQELNKGQKTKNFIRDHAGALSFLATTPMLIEEAMASIKGQKLANKVLSADMAKLVKKGNIAAYSTYALTAITAGIASWLTVKVKDHIIEKKKQKLEQGIIA